MPNSASMSYENCDRVPPELKKLPQIALCPPRRQAYPPKPPHRPLRKA